MNPFLIWSGLLLSLTGLTGCNNLSGLSFIPALPGYDKDAARVILLKKPLREISGIQHHHDNELMAVNDEEGAVFFVNAESGVFRKQIFGKKGDYEDIVSSDSAYYVLKSNGDLHELDIKTFREKGIYKGNFSKFTEFESLCYDKKNQQLLLICKSCGADQSLIHAWRFDLRTKTLLPDTAFSISITDVRHLGKDDTIEFQPSAASVHPLTGKLFIIASVGKLLVVCSPDGRPEAVYGVNADLFPQPEGICFAPNGDLYISNEGRQSKASILFFPYQSK